MSTLSYPLSKLVHGKLFRGEKVIYGKQNALLLPYSCGLLQSWRDEYLWGFLKSKRACINIVWLLGEAEHPCALLQIISSGNSTFPLQLQNWKGPCTLSRHHLRSRHSACQPEAQQSHVVLSLALWPSPPPESLLSALWRGLFFSLTLTWLHSTLPFGELKTEDTEDRWWMKLTRGLVSFIIHDSQCRFSLRIRKPLGRLLILSVEFKKWSVG